MTSFLFVLIVLAALATGFILVRGVMAMASGKDIGGVRQQKLMRQRVLLQAVAIVFAILFLWVARSGS